MKWLKMSIIITRSATRSIPRRESGDVIPVIVPHALGDSCREAYDSKTIIAKLSPPPPRIVTIYGGYICIGGPDSAPYGTGGTVSWGTPRDAQCCAGARHRHGTAAPLPSSAEDLIFV